MTMPVHRIPETLPADLRRPLKTYARLRAVWSAAAAAATGLLAAGLVVVAACAFDRFVDVPGLWRLPLTVLAALLAAAFAARAAHWLVRRVDYDEVAHVLDRAHGDGRDHLRSTLDFVRRGVAGHPFAAWAVARTLGMWDGARSGRYVDRRRAAIRLVGLGMLILAVGAVSRVPAVRAGLLWQRFLRPLGNHMRPSATWFLVDPPPAAPIHGGDDYVVRARLQGRPVAQPIPIAKIMVADGTTLIRKMQEAADGAWQVPLADVRHPFDFVVSMDRARSARYTVDVLPRPTATRLSVTYTYPRYTNLKKKTEVLTGRTITALEDTKVRLDIVANVPLRGVEGLVGDEVRRFTVSAKDPREAVCHLFLSANGRMDLKLTALNGLQSVREAPLQLRVIPDTPPTVNITGQWEQREFYVSEILEVGYKAQDDLGLMEIYLRSGSFEQEAELSSYGIKEAQGVLDVPLSILAKPGETAVKMRMLARDGKGQSAASREITVRVAVNSYDRQLRLARNGFSGKQDFRDLATCGYPALDRSAGRLAQLKLLAGKVTLLRETLAEGAKPGREEERTLDDIHSALRNLQPSFEYIRLGWDGEVFNWLSGAPLAPRLQTAVRDAVCGAELAVNATGLAQAVGQALADPNPKAALQGLTPRLDAALATQTDVVARLRAAHRRIRLELAGFLAETLDARLERATPVDWGNNDFALSVRSAAAELADLLDADPTLGSNDTIRVALQEKDVRAALERAKPALAPLASNLVESAVAAAGDPMAGGLPVAAYAEAGRPLSPAWMEVYALWLIMQAGSPGSDPVAQLQNGMRFLQIYGGGEAAYRPVGDANPAVRDVQEATVRVGMALARLRAEAESLRLGLVAGILAPGKPEMESHWIRMREHYLELRRLRDQPGLDGGLRNELSALVDTRLVALRHWVAPERDAAALGRTLGEWEGAVQTALLRATPGAQNALRVLDADLNGRWPALQAGAAAVRRDIAERIADLERFQASGATSAPPSRVYYPIWTLQIRLQAVEQSLLSMLDTAEACRLLGGGSVDLERMTLARTYLKKAIDYVSNPLLQLQNTIARSTALRGAVMQGKIREYRELDAIVGELEAVAAAPQTPEETARRLEANRAGVGHERERAQLRLALTMEASLGSKTNLVRALASERSASAALWGPVCHDAVLLRQAIQDGKDPGGIKPRVDKIMAVVGLIDPLPKDLQALPDILAGCAGDLSKPERRRQSADDLDGVLEALRPLAQAPPAAIGKEQAQADLLAVNRARVALVGGRPDQTRAFLAWAVVEMEWNRRKVRTSDGRLALGGLALGGADEFENLKLPKHLYLELKRAREHGMPELFRERAYQYLNTIMDKAR